MVSRLGNSRFPPSVSFHFAYSNSDHLEVSSERTGYRNLLTNADIFESCHPILNNIGEQCRLQMNSERLKMLFSGTQQDIAVSAKPAACGKRKRGTRDVVFDQRRSPQVGRPDGNHLE